MSLETDVLGRLVPPSTESDFTGLTVLAFYCNRLLEQARPDRMLHDIGAVPRDVRIRITYKGNAHMVDFLKHTSQFRSPLPMCTCGTPGGEHICTTSMSWIPDAYADIKRMLAKGLNHVPCAPLDVQAVCDVHAAVAESVAGPEFVQAARDWVVRMLAPLPIPEYDTLDVSREHPGIKYILHRCFVSCVDKACNQPMFICRHLAVSMVLKHCTESPAFDATCSYPDPNSIITSLRQFAPFLPAPAHTTRNIKPPKFATLYPVVKVHKSPVGWRMITSAVGTVLHNPAVVLQATTSCLLDELKQHCARLNQEAGAMHGCNVQFFPLISDGRVCLVNVNPRSRFLCDFSADVDHCFDVIPHTSLLASLRDVARMVTEAYRHMHRSKQPHFVIGCKPDGEQLVVSSVHLTHRNPSPGRHVLTVDAWLSLSEAVIANCFAQVAGHVFKVISGIPQGLHCSPDWCNLFLLRQEIRFVQSNLAASHDVLLHWYRQVDDVRVVVKATPSNLARRMSCSQWHEHLHTLLARIYPEPLHLSPTCELVNDEGVLCTTAFLDIRSSLLAEGTLHVELIRKEKKLPIPVCQYVHADSNRPLNQCYNVLIGLVMTAVWHNTAPGPCLADVLLVCKRFVSNGHQKHRVMQVVSKAMAKDYSFLRLEYDPGALWRANLWRVHQALSAV
jgi:hypothetical protein